MDPARVLARLRDPSDPAVADLIGVAFDRALARELRSIVDADVVASVLTEAIRTLAADDAVTDRLVERLEAERARWRCETRTLRGLSMPEVDDAVRAVAGVPWSPSEALAWRVLDHEAVRALLGEVLQGALSRFGDRLKTLDAGMLGGLGGAVAQRGRGLFGGLAHGLSGAADSLVGGLKDEMEQALQRRVRDQVAGATDEALKAIAAWVAAPDHMGALASLRRSIVDVVLDLPVGELLGEIDEVDLRPLAASLHDTLRKAAARPDLEPELARRAREVLAEGSGATLGEVLDALGLRAVARDGIRRLGEPAAHDLVTTDAFGAWWSALCR